MKALAKAASAAALSLTVGCVYFGSQEKKEDFGALAFLSLSLLRNSPEKEFRLPRPELNRATVVVDGEIHYDLRIQECHLKSWAPFITWVEIDPKYYVVDKIGYDTIPEETLYTFPAGPSWESFDEDLYYGSHRPTENSCVLHTLEYTDSHYEAEMLNCTVYNGNPNILERNPDHKKYHTISFRLRCVPPPVPDCAKNPESGICHVACNLPGDPEYPICKGCREQKPGQLCQPWEAPS